MFLKIENGKIVNMLYEKQDGYIEVADNTISMSLVNFYDYVDGKFIFNEDEYKRHLDKKKNQEKIDQLKKYLSDTDYIVIKIMEGVSSKEEYQEILQKRDDTRKEINRLQEL